MRDLKNNVGAVSCIVPAARTATVKGAAVDLQGFNAAAAVLHCGVYTNGGFTPKLQESDTTTDGDFTDVAAGDLEGAFVAITSAAGQNATQRVGYKGEKRYLRVVVTEGSSPAPATGMVFGATVLTGEAAARPVA